MDWSGLLILRGSLRSHLRMKLEGEPLYSFMSRNYADSALISPYTPSFGKARCFAFAKL